MANIKMRGTVLKRRDFTVPMTKEEEKLAKKFHVEEFRNPKNFIVRVNAAIPPSHKMCRE